MVMAQEALGQSRLMFTLSYRDVEELLAERGLDPFPRRMLGMSQRSLPNQPLPPGPLRVRNNSPLGSTRRSALSR
jgi:hypothetical protein